MNYKGNQYRTVYYEDGAVCLINQPLLPFSFEIIRSETYRETADHIRNMTVRGAPAIGGTAAYGMVQGFNQGETEKAEEVLAASRPTAKDLFTAIAFMKEQVRNDPSPDTVLKAAEDYCDRSVEECRMIGEHGNALLKNNTRILTHCNAGWLATVDWGTALSPMFAAKQSGKNIFVYVDETKPRGQGARLTAWELYNEGIDHAVIPDNAAAHYMSLGRIDIVITGADRVAANGDAANKIGTLEKAICAKRFNIPFYIAAPATTFDMECTSGKEIPIEERNPDEVKFRTGRDENGNMTKVEIVNPGSDALNPAFDVTPAELITGYITPEGLIKSGDIPDFISKIL